LKYIKLFDNKNPNLKIGNYVLVNVNYPDLIYFINNNIGQIVEISGTHNDDLSLRIKYNNIPNDIKIFFRYDTRWFEPSEIIYIGKTIEDVELQIDTNKYNI
jgi:hypothetical protein